MRLINNFFRHFTKRDPLSTTVLPNVDTRSQEELDALKIAEWRSRVRSNELRREQQREREEFERTLKYLQQAS